MIAEKKKVEIQAQSMGRQQVPIPIQKDSGCSPQAQMLSMLPLPVNQMGQQTEF